MFQQENEEYIPYQERPQYAPSTPVGVLDRPQVPPVQETTQPSYYPTGPQPTSTLPKRPRRRGAILVLVLVLAIIFGVGLFSGWEFAGNHNSTATTSTSVTTSSTSQASSASANTAETQQEAAIAKVEPAVVELNVTTAQGQQIGSGVIIDTNGDIVTNNHVVNGAQTITALLSNGATEKAQLVGTDTKDDLAVVHIAPFTHMTIAQVGNSSNLTVGQEVLAIGNPLGITQTATRGIVSALNRSVTESAGTTISNAIQTDASINPGNSGGALINLQGQLVGIPTLGAVNTESNTPANGVGFAIPSNLVQMAVQQMLQQG